MEGEKGLGLTINTDIPALTDALVRHPQPFKPFLPLLKASSNVEDALPLLTSTVLSNLIQYAIRNAGKDTTQVDAALPHLYTYLAALSNSSDAGLQDIAMQQYSAVLRSTSARELFWKQRAETLEPLFNILRAAGGTTKDQDSTLWSGGSSSARTEGIAGGVGLQLLYHVLLVIWQLSFDAELVGDGLQEYVSFPFTKHPIIT